MESKALNKMNVRDRYKAKKEAQEEAYYKGQEAPKTTFVDTGNGITEMQTNSDKNEPINEPQKKQTTLQNYKPVEQAQPEAKPEVPAEPKPEVQAEEVPQPEVQPEAEPDADITGQVSEVDEGMMDQVGINPKNTEQENQKNTENIINKITGNRNKDGTYKPLNKWEYADGIQQFGMLATIASIGLAVLTRGAFPPVDFSAITGLNESYAKYVEGIDNYNKYVRQAQGENSYESERAKGSIEDANKAAQLNLTTENQQKERDAKWSEYLKNVDAVIAQDKAKLDHELEVALQDVLTAGQLDVINANAEVQKAVLELMYKQDVNKLADQGKAILDAGFSLNDLNKLAQFSKSQSGQTYFENILKSLKAGTEVVNAGANVMNSAKPGINVNNNTGSDSGTKEFFKRMIKF